MYKFWYNQKLNPAICVIFSHWNTIAATGCSIPEHSRSARKWDFGASGASWFSVEAPVPSCLELAKPGLLENQTNNCMTALG
jgi:hypothetical protein